LADGEPVRILRVIARLNMGGPALHVAYLAAGLRERGYETTLVAGTLARGEDSMAFVAEDLGVRVEQVPELSREISPLRDLRAALRLARLIRRERPRILHTHTAKAGLYGGLAARMIGIRAVVGSLSAFACQMPDRAYDFLPQPLATVSRRNVFRNKLAAKSMRFLVAVSSTLGRRFCEYNGVPLDKLRVTRSMRQSAKRFEIRIDTCFPEVIRACADPSRESGWITPEFIDAYTALHRLGWAHSVEVFDREGALAGGLYGVRINGLFAGESMFYVQRDASKVALMALVETMRASGMTLLDVQWRTDHLESLGAVDVPRSEYLALLAKALESGPP